MSKFSFLPPSKEEVEQDRPKAFQGPEMSRRNFLKGGAARAVSPLAKSAEAESEVYTANIHNAEGSWDGGEAISTHRTKEGAIKAAKEHLTSIFGGSEHFPAEEGFHPSKIKVMHHDPHYTTVFHPGFEDDTFHSVVRHKIEK